MKEVIEKCIKLQKTLSTMESCTGGAVVNEITNIEGASDVVKFSAITYSNEYKVKMGVSPQTIEKYSVYSMEVADEMSKAISDFTNSDYGIGITGELNHFDKDNIVYMSIYDREKNTFFHQVIEVRESSRKENKEFVVKEIVKMLLKIMES